MTDSKRVFILGAGFSKPAGMPLATELLPRITDKLRGQADMQEWLDSQRERMAWLSGEDEQADSFALNIEEVFHYAHFDMEAHRLRQHLASVGRGDGLGTPWNYSESIAVWLSHLEEALRDVILDREDHSDLASIKRWAKAVRQDDAVLTFNYDTLVERTLTELGRPWSHGTGIEGDSDIPVFKMHGSIDWIVAHRSESFSKLDLLFDKPNVNRSNGNTGHTADDCRLWRCRTRSQLHSWISGRNLQKIPNGACPRTVGIAGLGAYKQLHQIPGLGPVWVRGMQALHKADTAVIVGFSMSDFDAMAQMQFAAIAMDRKNKGQRLRVIVIDPVARKIVERFRRVFRCVDLLEESHEGFDWSRLD